MMEWWTALSGLNQAFYALAAFCSIFFGAQLLFSMGDLGGDDAGDFDGDVDGDIGGDVDGDIDVDGDVDLEGDVHGDMDLHGDVASSDAKYGPKEVRGAVAAKEAIWRGLLSLRSLLAFLMLFGWAGALYLQEGKSALLAVPLAAMWGVLGSVVVALLLLAIRKLQQDDVPHNYEAVGQQAYVNITIPGGGVGRVRVSLGGRIQFRNARSADSADIPAGSEVYVVGVVDERTLEVAPVERLFDDAPERKALPEEESP